MVCFLTLVQNKKSSPVKDNHRDDYDVRFNSPSSTLGQAPGWSGFSVSVEFWRQGNIAGRRPGPGPRTRSRGCGGCLCLIGPWWRNVSRCRSADLSHLGSSSPYRQRRGEREKIVRGLSLIGECSKHNIWVSLLFKPIYGSESQDVLLLNWKKKKKHQQRQMEIIFWEKEYTMHII